MSIPLDDKEWARCREMAAAMVSDTEQMTDTMRFYTFVAATVHSLGRMTRTDRVLSAYRAAQIILDAGSRK